MLEKIKDFHDIKDLDYKELSYLADDIREFLIESISKTGGHLASNLGIVELTLSLFRNFDFDQDKIVFDVGHQSYVYKLLTGRKEGFKTLRQFHGMSGFPKRNESKYDFFETGHSSTSISAALGIARARDLKKENHHVIAFIGDGALTGGMVYEALNDVGDHKTNLIIILNDNEMSISNNVGGLSNHFNDIRISSSYNKLKEKVHLKLDKKRKVVNTIHRLKSAVKSLFVNSSFFEDLGIKYIGVMDGHNLKELDHVLKKVKNYQGPVVIHVATKKGLGYTPAMENPGAFHAVGPFDIATGEAKKKGGITYSSAFGTSMVNLAKKEENLVAITAAMTSGTGLSSFQKEYPSRFFDVGIAEEHATTFASGLASQGLIPVFAVYSTFLQRAFDQIIHDVCMPSLPVIFAIDRAGIVGNDGETHQGVFDLSYLSLMPNMTIVVPKCMGEMEPILEFAIQKKSPVAIRYPRGGDDMKLKALKKFTLGKWEVVSKGEKIAILAVGKMVGKALLAKEKCKENIEVINACFVKPIDEKMVDELIKRKMTIMTLEDNTLKNGFSSQVLSYLNQKGYSSKVHMMGYQDHFIEHGSVEELYTLEHINVEDIVEKIKEISKVNKM